MFREGRYIPIINKFLIAFIVLLMLIPAPVMAETVTEDFLPSSVTWQAAVTDGNTYRYDGVGDGYIWKAWIYRTGDGATTWTPDNPIVDVLVVGGGGGGGCGSGGGGGGGGAGGLIYESSFSLTSGNPISLTIGDGGTGSTVHTVAAGDGDNSVFSTLTAIGGGGGGTYGINAGDGGSGGGGGFRSDHGQGTNNQGYDGGTTAYNSYPGGGGGGASEAGAAPAGTDAEFDGAKGGDGSEYFGVYYAGGGGGSVYRTYKKGGAGGLGGGGRGGDGTDGAPTSGTPNTGGGGGGRSIGEAGAGGSGIIIVRYLPPAPTADFSANPVMGYAPLTVDFTDLSTGKPAESWKWEYGISGSWTQFSTTQHPSYQFASGGLYSIRLTVTAGEDEDTKTRTDYIGVIGGSDPTPTPTPGPTPTPTPTPVPSAPRANFISDKRYSSETPVSITFSDRSSYSPTSWTWYTKNSSGSSWTQFSTNQNPSYTYTEYGSYDVRLFTSNAYGDSTEDKLRYILLAPSLRPKTNVTAIVPPTTHYQTVIDAFGADIPPTHTPPEIEWMDIAGAIESWYTDSLGMFFYVFVFSIPFVIQYLRQGTMIIPSVLGIITAGFLLMYVPAEYELVAVAFIALGILGIIWGVVKERM